MDESRRAAVVFWALLFASDHMRQGHRRDISEIAKEAGVSESSTRRQIAEQRVPSTKNLWPLARVAGMNETLVRAATEIPRVDPIILSPDADEFRVVFVLPETESVMREGT